MNTNLFEVSVRSTEEGQRVLFGCGQSQRREQHIAVTDRRNAVDGHPAGDLQPHLAEVVDVARRLSSTKAQTNIGQVNNQWLTIQWRLIDVALSG